MQKFDTINVIPFVDIMLVLLAIVLTTATFVQNGDLEITLPKASAEASNTQQLIIEIAIDANGQYYLDGDAVLPEQLTARLALVSKQTRVALLIDENVRFNRFVTLIDSLKSLSLDNVSIATRKTQ